MASRKGSRMGWRWIAIGASLAVGMAIYGGKRMSGRSRRAMARDRGATRFPASPAASPSAGSTAASGAQKPTR